MFSSFLLTAKPSFITTNKATVPPYLNKQASQKASERRDGGNVQHSPHQFGNIPVYANTAPALQTKLQVNTPGDKYEQEADKVADAITKMPDASSIQRKCAKCEEEEKTGLQRKEISTGINIPANQAAGIAHPVLSDRISASHGKGSFMNEPVQSAMSQGFGANFSKVKIHADNEAAAMNRGLNARAFTINNNIYFNSGEYRPETGEGKRLLAHELTHVVQQSGGGAHIQKDDKDPTNAAKPEIDFSLLPPDLKFRIHHLVFEADTGHVQLDYHTRQLKTGLSYKYGGQLSLSLGTGDSTFSAGWTPGDNQFSLGLKRPGFGVNFSATPQQNKFGASLHLGDKLLPPMADMGQTFNKGGAAAGNLLTGLPGVAEDPLNFYQQHKSDIDDVSKSVDLVKQVTEQGKKKIRFGADFSITYDPQSQWVVGGKVGVMF